MISFVHRATVNLHGIRFPTDALIIGEARVLCPDTDNMNMPDEIPGLSGTALARLLKDERMLAHVHYAYQTGRKMPAHLQRELLPLDVLVEQVANGYVLFGLAKDDAAAGALVKCILDQVTSQVQRQGR